jgi:hypothetical protein
MLDLQKANRMAKQKPPYTRQRAFPGALSYREYFFERLEKHDNFVAGEFLRRHHGIFIEQTTRRIYVAPRS